MELPKKLIAPEGCAWNEDSPHFKINGILDYLESQKEGEEPFIQHGGHLYDKTGNEVCCEKAKEEPKQIEEVFWKGYSKGVDVQIEKDYLSKEQLEEIKRALQQ